MSIAPQLASSLFILASMDRLWTPWRYEYVSNVDTDKRKGVPSELSAWPTDTGCVFCNLLGASAYALEQGSMSSDEADRAANIIYRDRRCFICLNSYPYNSGHAMIVPYKHTDKLCALDGAIASEMMTLAQRLEGTLRKIYSPDGINLGMNLGKAAGAGVAGHVHMHMLPRWVGDTNFMTVVGETRVLPESLKTTWKRLREEFRQ